MSLWTHVNGIIRVDQLNSTGLAYKNELLPKFKDQPEGSEGPLTVDIVTEGPCGSENSGPGGTWVDVSYRWAVLIVGDLRDYGHTQKEIIAIIRYVKKATKDLWIRSGVIEIEVEYCEPVILQFRPGHFGRGVWRLIGAINRKEK